MREACWSIFDSGEGPPLSRGLASNPLRLSLRSGIAPGANAREGEKWFSPSLAVDAAAVMRTSASRHVKLRETGSMELVVFPGVMLYINTKSIYSIFNVERENVSMCV